MNILDNDNGYDDNNNMVANFLVRFPLHLSKLSSFKTKGALLRKENRANLGRNEMLDERT